MATAFLVSGCQVGTQPPQTAAIAPTVDLRQKEIEERKDEMIRQLAHCESGGSGPSERPIYGGRGAFVGRLQFSLQTVISYQRKRDGTVLNRQEALDLAHDYPGVCLRSQRSTWLGLSPDPAPLLRLKPPGRPARG